MNQSLIITFLFTIYFLFPAPTNAQRNNTWYFGNYSGLDFNDTTGAALPLPLSNNAMKADEGCSSMSDEQGRILFYTNGVEIYNRNFQVMANGDDIGGHISAFQSSMIVQHPGQDHLYYVFTSDAYENQNAKGHRYAVVDIKANDSNGVVLSKNMILSATGTERLAAARHANGIDVWVITNDPNSNTFRAWLVNCAGLQTNPVVSVVGDVPGMHELVNVGALKFSPDGKMLCQTHFQDLLAGDLPPDFFQLFDFNNSTGVLSNPRRLEFPSVTYVNCEFSPNSEYLYLTKGNLPSIDQFNVKLATTASIMASRTIIPAPSGILAMQLGPDGRIYVAPYGRQCGIINKPDLPYPSCDYQPEQLELTRAIMGGFPASVNDLSSDPYNNLDFQVLDSCLGQVRFTGSTSMSGAISWSWDFGDGTISTLQNPIHTFNPVKKNYIVRLVITSLSGCGKITRQRVLNPSGVDAVLAFDQFGGCDSGYARFENLSTTLVDPGFYYTWDFGDGHTSSELQPTHVYSQPGSYIVKLKLHTNKACLDDSITAVMDMVTFNGTVTASEDRVIFEGQTIQLFSDGPGNNYEWTPSTGLNNAHIHNPKATPAQDITYKVKVSNQTGCFAEEEVKISVVEPTDVYIPTGFTPNNDGRNDLLMPIFGSKYMLESFTVFNRWGERIFNTSERWAGWDGRINGALQATGIYVWTIRIKDPSGEMITRKGTAALIR